jgi:malate permease and related proteins
MGNLFVILICLAIGLVLQKDRRLPDSLASSLNTYVIYVALPALVLFEIPLVAFGNGCFDADCTARQYRLCRYPIG